MVLAQKNTSKVIRPRIKRQLFPHDGRSFLQNDLQPLTKTCCSCDEGNSNVYYYLLFCIDRTGNLNRSRDNDSEYAGAIPRRRLICGV